LANLEQRLSAQKSFEGEGQSDQSNQLRGTIQAMVVEVLPNKVLRVEGEKVIAINQGDETVRISGLVRLQDITTDNTVSSTQVANAVITYGGSGIVADSNDMGWLGKFFNSKWFPF
ncbi:MAG TPA: flagellar basal body L-ring protein, partial [Chromatiales bacterium]|nr:flagellar basal body L-ring protein [Chromatiales bacterium]